MNFMQNFMIIITSPKNLFDSDCCLFEDQCTFDSNQKITFSMFKHNNDFYP